MHKPHPFYLAEFQAIRLQKHMKNSYAKIHYIPVSLWLFFSTFPISAILDDDNDGMSDFWEAQYNFNIGASSPVEQAPSADPDSDGWDNLTEAIAGTDPFSSISPDGYVKTLLTVTRETGVVELQWKTLAGKLYQIQRSEDLSDWYNYGETITNSTANFSYTFDFTENGQSFPEKTFMRLSIYDMDSDVDGLSDYEENQFGSSPANHDTDGDGVWDIDEKRLGTPVAIPKIWNFHETLNGDGTVTFSWNSYAQDGDWFKINEKQTDGSWKVIYETTYGSALLPYMPYEISYSITLNPATDFLP